MSISLAPSKREAERDENGIALQGRENPVTGRIASQLSRLSFSLAKLELERGAAGDVLAIDWL